MEPKRKDLVGAKDGPAYYAAGKHTLWRDIRAVLHPPYTAWHLSYVVMGSLIGPTVNWSYLGATVLAFFLAVGVAAHSLDELKGRPLETSISSHILIMASVIGLAGAVSIGVIGVYKLGPFFALFVIIGTVLVVAYNLELFGGRIHTDLGFALAWGAFPVLAAAFAQEQSLRAPAIALALSGALLSAAQRSLSNPARLIRRQAVSVEGRIVLADGIVQILDRSALLAPLEKALRFLSWATIAFAMTLILFRLTI